MARLPGENETLDVDDLSSPRTLSAIKKDGDIICNACGKSLYEKLWSGPPPKEAEYEACGLVEKVVCGGYSSPDNGLMDCTSYRFSLCENCLKKMFDTFKIPPETWDYMKSNSKIIDKVQESLKVCNKLSRVLGIGSCSPYDPNVDMIFGNKEYNKLIVKCTELYIDIEHFLDAMKMNKALK